jgi:CRISPR-associated protein Cas5d
MNEKNSISITVEGEFACFTRPDLKVERMTYPCMTPSAARGILDAILWKPEFKWHVHRIKILKPVRFFSVKRNEINSKQGRNPITIDAVDNRGKPLFRSQRNSIILKDVAYTIEASVHLDEYSEQNPPMKYVEIFNRRVRKGQCYRRPYLGCREFAAEFRETTEADVPISEDIPIGSMLLDVFRDEDGTTSARFFYNVAVRQGVLDCSEVYKEMLPSSHIRPPLDDQVSRMIYELNGGEVEA